MSLQLPLAVSLDDTHSFDAFYQADNAELVKALQAAARSGDPRFVYISGKPGTGKSHLLQATAQQAQQAARQAFYVGLELVTDHSPDILQGLENADLVCLDNLHLVAGKADWEAALFSLFNRLQDQGHGLIVTADQAPVDSGIQLPDLVSRLQSGLLYRMRPLSDDQKLKALQKRADRRGMDLPDDAGEWLIKRCPRDLPWLFDFLGEMDLASLAAKKKRLTIPFLRQTLDGRLPASGSR